MSQYKDKYQILCNHNYIPLFYRACYLDAITKDWDVIIDGNDVWVYFLKKKWGLRYIITPQLVPYLGYWSFDEGIDINRYKVLKEKLPHHHVFIDNLHPRYNDINQKKYTYIIDHQEVDQAFANIKPKHRRSINKSLSTLKIGQCADYSVFANVVIKSFEKKNRENPYPMEILQKLNESLSQSKNRTIFTATNEDHEISAVLYIAFDEKTTYNLVTANLFKDRALYALLWIAIKWSMETGRSFDFEGSMIPGVENFFKGFGGKKTYYPYVYEASNPLIAKIVKLKNPNIEI